MDWVLQHAKRIARISAGAGLILIAALLGFIPGVPGWPLALVGLSILAIDFVWAHRLKTKLHQTAAKALGKWPAKTQAKETDPAS